MAGRGIGRTVDPGELARFLGWFSIGLGLAELLAPRGLCRALGLGDRSGLVRAYGAREVATGVAILTQPDPAPWVWARVAGDVLDLGTLGSALGPDNPRRGEAAAAFAAVAGVTALDVHCARELSRGRGYMPSAPPGDHERLLHRPAVERSLTIQRPADELHRRWLDPATVAAAMAHFAEVRPAGEGKGLRWRVDGPLGRTLEWETRVVDDRPGELISWESLPGAAMPSAGSVRFAPATGDRGTVVTLRFRFDPPGGAFGEAVARLLGGAPDLIAAEALRRFKGLVEPGGAPATDHQPAASADTR